MLVILLVVFIDLVGFGVVIPLLPFYGEHFAASPLVITLLMATYSGMQLVASPLWGRLSDRVGRRRIILISLTTSVASYLWLAHADTLWMLFAARALQGASAGNISVGQAYIADVTTPANRAKGMGMLGAAIGMGFIVGPIIGGELAGANPTLTSVALPAYVAAGLSALSFLLAALRLPESLPAAARISRGEQPGRMAQLRDAFSRPRLRLLMALFFITTFAFAGMEATFALWADARFQWGPEQVGHMFGLVGVMLVLVQGGLTGRLTKRFGEARLLLVGTITIGIGLLLMALATQPALGVFAGATLAAGMGLVSPSTSSLISREARAIEQGGILGVNQSVGSSARLFGPAVAGAAFGAAGPGAPYVIGACLMVVSAWLATRVLRQRPAPPVGLPAEAP